MDADRETEFRVITITMNPIREDSVTEFSIADLGIESEQWQALPNIEKVAMLDSYIVENYINHLPKAGTNCHYGWTHKTDYPDIPRYFRYFANSTWHRQWFKPINQKP